MAKDAQAERNQALRAAHELEKRGDIEGALKVFLGAGAPDHAARLHARQGRFTEAGKLLMTSLGVHPSAVGKLDAPSRKKALMASVWLARGGDLKTAIGTMVRLGEIDRAIDTLERAGDHVGAAKLRAKQREMMEKAAARKTGTPAPPKQPDGRVPSKESTAVAMAAVGVPVAEARQLEQAGKLDLAIAKFVEARRPEDAARVAQRMGNLQQAGELYADAGMFYEAAAAFLKGGHKKQSLETLLRLGRGDPRYQKACIYAIRLARELNQVEYRLEHFLTPFVETGPCEAQEAQAFYELGRLYEVHNMPENAMEAYRMLLGFDDSFGDTVRRLAALEQGARGSDADFEEVLRQDEAFRGSDGRPSGLASNMPYVQDLPELPDLPPMGGPPPGPTPTPYPSGPTPTPYPSGPTPTPYPSGPTPTPYPSGPTPTPYPVGPTPTSPNAGTMGAQQGAPPPGSPGSYPPAGGQPAPGDPYAGFHEGATVANRYRLEKMIGKGGMAMVFKATDTDLEEEVALKVFLTIDDSTMIERFKQELKLSRKLNHPNIIRLYDIGVFNHRRYISMELLRGDTLKNMLGDPLPFAQGMDYLIQSARGLHVAHEKGVIHRDIKPDNLFVTEDGKVKVMDFGIAKQQSTRGLTATGMIAGTPEYMSPEQINNFSKVGPSTDLYALGIVAYEMFTGRVPFWDEELMTLLIMHVTRPPRPPSKRNPEIPPPLEKCILKLLQKDPAMRHPTCQDLADELEKLSAQFG